MKRKNGPITGDISEAGYVRIRKYVIDNIIHGEKKPQRLASMRELAAQFGVGCTTVQKALKDLVADGYLTPKTGVGMFTNPQRWRRTELPQIIELLAADGRQIYFENYLCCLSSMTAMAITRAGYSLHYVDLFQNNQGALSEVKQYSQGLFWLAPGMVKSERAQEFFRALTVPGVVIAGVVDGFDAADYNHELEGYQIAKKLLAEGRRNILIFGNSLSGDREVIGVRRAFAEASLTFDAALLLDHYQDIVKQFEGYYQAYGVPEAIYDTGGGPIRLWGRFRELGIDFVKQCRLVMADDRPSPLPCWMLRHDFGRLADNAMELLQLRIKDPARRPEVRLFCREIYDDTP